MNSLDNAVLSSAQVEDWSYGATEDDVGGGSPSLSIYADRAMIRSILSEDAQAAGLRVGIATDLSSLTQIDGVPLSPLSDVVLIDCPVVDAQTLAALASIDQRAARAGTRVIISTTVDTLDDVFGCMDQSGAQILVDPDRAERVIALGHVIAQLPSGRVRELSEDERHLLMRLTEQVGQIAGRMDRLAPSSQALADAMPSRGHTSAISDVSARILAPEDARTTRAARPSLPDPRLVRRIIRQRQNRSRYFDSQLFADPAWDMLLDLSAARAEHRRVSVTSLCIASGVPPTTALRWIGQMVEQGLFARAGDQVDRRRAFIELTDRSADAMARYFAEMGTTVPVI